MRTEQLSGRGVPTKQIVNRNIGSHRKESAERAPNFPIIARRQMAVFLKFNS